MSGVEVLAMEEVVTEFAFNLNAFWVAAVIVFGIFVTLGIIISIALCDWSNLFAGLIVGVIFGLIFGGVAGNEYKIEKAYETQYKVVISDEVSMNEFTENYEIIDQEGKIYTVRYRN